MIGELIGALIVVAISGSLGWWLLRYPERLVAIHKELNSSLSLKVKPLANYTDWLAGSKLYRISIQAAGAVFLLCAVLALAGALLRLAGIAMPVKI